MSVPKAMARFNRLVLNHLTRPLAGRVPGLGVLLHQGRRSGKTYRTPVNVFRTASGYTFALTYGPDTDWVKNVLACGRCVLHTGGRDIALDSPRVVHDESRSDIRIVERQVLKLLQVADFLQLRVASPDA
jgi:deazaflavin-dependent oxidoreductase (nitroreductase family)